MAQQRTYEIYFGYSQDSAASSFITPAHLSCVYNGGHIPLVANQWLEFNLTSPFFYNPDSGNLVVIFRDLTGSYAPRPHGATRQDTSTRTPHPIHPAPSTPALPSANAT